MHTVKSRAYRSAGVTPLIGDGQLAAPCGRPSVHANRRKPTTKGALLVRDRFRSACRSDMNQAGHRIDVALMSVSQQG